MKVFLTLLCSLIAFLASENGTFADTAKQKRLAQQWSSALDAIDESSSVVGLVLDGGCIFAASACDRAQKFAQRIAIKYRRLALRSWKARGMTLPAKCLTLSFDGAQIDRVIAAYDRAQGQLKYKLFAPAYDLLAYGFISWADLECQNIAREEIFRIRKLTMPSASI
ncbi:MAG: hypothetical protein JXQ99_23180 [Hyphomicrobiaceae bacterium]